MKQFIRSYFLLFGMVAAVAQTPDWGNSSENLLPETGTTTSINDRFDVRTLNLPKEITTTFESSPFQGSNRIEHDIEPFAQLDIMTYRQIKNAETGEEILFSQERIGNTVYIRTYTNDIEVDRTVEFDVPESTNAIFVQNHYSTNFFTTDGQAEFMVFVHYFENDIPHPDNQISEIWVVNEAGETLKVLDATSAHSKIDNQNNKKIITFVEDEEEEKVIINSFNPETWELQANYTYDSELIRFFMGVPMDFYMIDGEEHIVLGHYKHLFMDNMTLEIFPDNNLVIKILNLDLEEVDSFYLDIETRYPDEFLIPRAEFGMFYRDNKYNLSKDIFNSDDKFEIVYGISYYNMMMDVEWTEFILANEDGEILGEINEQILFTDSGLTEIEGFDNQLAFLFGEDGMATNIGFFDIESWEMVAVFEAVHQEDLLSDNLNRIATEDSYNWLIGLGEPDYIDGQIYGVINEYGLDQNVVHRHQFPLVEGVLNFQPVLARYSLEKDFYINDGERYFTYVYMEQIPGGGTFNNLVITKDGEENLIEFRGDTEQGNLVGTTLFTDANRVFDKMAVLYQPDYNTLLSDFYRIPLVTLLGVDDQAANQLVFYPNPTTGDVNIRSNAEIAEIIVIDLSGKVLLNRTVGSTTPSFDFSNLASGLYIAKIKTADGNVQNVKFIKQ